MTVALHPQLEKDCYILGTVNSSTLLLHKNALLPWFILVPDTTHNELFKLDSSQQNLIQSEINALAEFTQNYFKSDKLNIATIGNVVPQLHVHIIGRKENDFCWPSPVWGRTEFLDYDPDILFKIKQALLDNNLITSV